MSTMTWCLVGRLIVIVAMLALPASGYAQDAVLSGTITDSTGGVLPGVVINAVHEATGNTFKGVSDERGGFRLAVRTGVLKVTLELDGFATLTRSVELLVGQTAVVAFQMMPSSVQETILVTGESPLIDVSKSSISGNIDPRQMQDLPLNGRNWQDLTMLAPGSRQNAVSDTLGGADYHFQINIDGQQVTQLLAGNFGQARYSREAIAEFEFISNRFDASQGRSSGVQVNAITKSGTNTPSGSFSGYFRDDKFNAADFIQHRVVPYSNQQLAWTFGGPILKDKIHLFGNYEYEREPQTFTYTSSYSTFNIDQPSKRIEQKGGLRLDFQFSPRTRLTVRGNKSVNHQPIDSRYSGGANRHPSSGIESWRYSNNLNVGVTQVLGTHALNEVRAGYAGFYWVQNPVVAWPNHPYPGLTNGTPIINLQGYTIGQGHTNSYQLLRQDPYSIRDDFTLSFEKRGRHAMKIGSEYIYMPMDIFICDFCMGILNAQGQGAKIPANLEALFPVWNDVSTWNLAALSPIVQSYRIGIGQMKVYPRRHEYAGWIQDDWTMTPRLTLNLGLRYDFGTGNVLDVSYPPFLAPGRKADKTNVGPRVGFAYSLTDKTVVRGGFGKYFANEDDNAVFWTLLTSGEIQAQQLNDRRPDFAANPFNGPVPTYDQAVDLWKAGQYTRFARTLVDPDMHTQYSYQTSIGVQRQLGNTMAIEADYIFQGNHNVRNILDVNLAYNPATGANYPFTDRTKKPNAGWDDVNVYYARGQDDYRALQVALTKRFNGRWQASATYLLAGQWNLQQAPTKPGCQYPVTTPSPGVFTCDAPIQLHPVLVEEWYLAGDQRNRAVFNGIWQIGGGFQLSGLYLYGDNGYETPSSGVDVLRTGLQIGGASGNQTASLGRVRPDGTVIPRNSFNRSPIHRVDARLQRRFKLAGRFSIDGIVEMFNVFNHANFGTFVTNQTNRQYGQPSFDPNIAYAPRMLQLGFRAAF